MNREEIIQLAKQHIEKGKPCRWFEKVYAQVNQENLGNIPWADLKPNPNLVPLFAEKQKKDWQGKRALVIGCGLGDDAAFLHTQGLKVNAFDISPTAIQHCKRRFGHFSIHYFVDNLLTFQPKQSYDLIVEIYTLQCLSETLRAGVLAKLAQFLATNGELIIICRGRNENEGNTEFMMPFPLSKKELLVLNKDLLEIRFDDYEDIESSGVRRFRAVYRKVGF